MALKRISQLPAFNGVAVSQTATLDLPIGPRYHTVWLKFDNTAHDDIRAATAITQIRVKVNGKVQRTMSPAELIALNALYDEPASTVMGTAASAKYSGFNNTAATELVDVQMVPIFFAEPWRPNAQVSEALAWSTGDLTSFQIEVDIAAGAGPALTAFAEVDNAVVTTNGLQKSQPMGLITKWSRFTVPCINGILNYTSIPRRDVLLQYSIFNTAACQVSNVQVKADNYEWRNLSAAENAAVLRARGMNPVIAKTATAAAVIGGRYDLVFDYDDLPPGAGLRADGIQDLQFNITADAQASLTTILQTLGRPD